MSRDLDLQTLILAFLAEHPGKPYKPHEIATGLSANLHGRHVGVAAVTNHCRNLADLGRIWQVKHKPFTFAYPANDDTNRS